MWTSSGLTLSTILVGGVDFGRKVKGFDSIFEYLNIAISEYLNIAKFEYTSFTIFKFLNIQKQVYAGP